jgi:hypothetical protein
MERINKHTISANATELDVSSAEVVVCLATILLPREGIAIIDMRSVERNSSRTKPSFKNMLVVGLKKRIVIVVDYLWLLKCMVTQFTPRGKTYSYKKSMEKRQTSLAIYASSISSPRPIE